MDEIICTTPTFKVEVQNRPFVSREDGGHFKVTSRLKVKDRTELTVEQATKYTLLSMLVGKALELAMTKRGIEIGNVNWQEMGNWSVFKLEFV